MSASPRRHRRRRHHLLATTVALDRLRQAVDTRQSWLADALSTQPANRPAAQAAICGLYELAGQPPPRFVWVGSPKTALDVVPEGTYRPGSDGPVLVDARIAAGAARLRDRLSPNEDDLDPAWWPGQAPEDPVQAIRSGRTLRFVLARAVRVPLESAIRHGVADSLRAALPAVRGLAWYGQHDAAWVAALDAQRRFGYGRFLAADSRQLDLWVNLVRSCGWWCPREGVCVIAERPLRVRTETLGAAEPGPDDVVRLHCPDGPAVLFPDGWSLHAWHGTRVPSWVIEDPTAEHILAEPNAEVRRCAVERIGWDAFVTSARLGLVASAADPGNPGCTLELYDLPEQGPIAQGRLLLAVNGSVERDGTRRRYGLTVPAWVPDPVAAAAWTYGLRPAQYELLQRRT